MAYSSHFAACLHAHDSARPWVNFEVCNPDGSPAKPGLRHYSHEDSLSGALGLVRHIQWRFATMARDVPTLVVWVEGETSTGAYESTTVAPCGQLSLLDYRTTPNTTTC